MKFFNAKDLDFIKTISEEVVDYLVEQALFYSRYLLVKPKRILWRIIR